jgi:hypothetical protein
MCTQWTLKRSGSAAWEIIYVENCLEQCFSTSGTHPTWWSRCSVVGWGTMLQAGRSRVRFHMRSLVFLNLPNPSSRTMTLGSTQPLREMSTRNLPGGKGWAECKADNLTAFCDLYSVLLRFFGKTNNGSQAAKNWESLFQKTFLSVQFVAIIPTEETVIPTETLPFTGVISWSFRNGMNIWFDPKVHNDKRQPLPR